MASRFTIFLGILCLAGSCLFGVLAFHSSSHDANQGLVATSLVGDLGTIPQGGSDTFTFALCNLSTNSLQLLKVETSCSCISPQFEPRSLSPQERYDLPITFNVGQNRGRTQTRAVVSYQSNANSKPQMLTLMLVADVAPEIVVSPKRLSFPKQPPFEATLTLSGGVMKHFELISAVSNHRAFSVRVVESSPTKVSLAVKFDPSLWRGQSKMASVSLTTTGVAQSTIEVPLVPGV